jgi:acyl transferase domain-containing protein
MDRCFDIITRVTKMDFKTLMWEGDPEEVLKHHNSTASFSLQYATFKLWESLGVKPDMVLGHSVGEYAAAAAAGFLDVEDVLKVTYPFNDFINYYLVL